MWILSHAHDLLLCENGTMQEHVGDISFACKNPGVLQAIGRAVAIGLGTTFAVVQVWTWILSSNICFVSVNYMVTTCLVAVAAGIWGLCNCAMVQNP